YFAGIEARVQVARDFLLKQQQGLREQYTLENKVAVDRASVELRGLLLDEEIILKQKLKRVWLSLMDRCTSYLYVMLKARRKRKCISSLTLEDGTVVNSAQEIGGELVRYFRGLLRSAGLVLGPLDVEVVQ
ncbi:hypothetical protein Dimus_032360, partial [Dionaea muscipula]